MLFICFVHFWVTCESGLVCEYIDSNDQGIPFHLQKIPCLVQALQHDNAKL